MEKEEISEEQEQEEYLNFILNEVMSVFEDNQVIIHDAKSVISVVVNILNDLHQEHGCEFDFTSMETRH
jgi:hypothetical protein